MTSGLMPLPNSGLMPLAGPGLAPLPARHRTRPQRSAPRTRTTTRSRTRTEAAPQRAGEGRLLAGSVLGCAVLLEGVVLLAPQALSPGAWQAGAASRMVSGYPMLVLLVFAMAFGWLRRRTTAVAAHRRLHALHQSSGLAILLLLAVHAATRPSGFLLLTFHAMAVGQGAGALRGVLGARAGRQGATALLMLHVGLACLVCAAALLHLWFVYTYTG